MLRKSGRIFFTTKKKEVNHRDTENTEAKQKRIENMEKRVSRKGVATQRKEEKKFKQIK